ncbi:MAG TPA: hypothetical protein VFS39_05650 [Nitrospira sp.]|nr:hypothetical protein [Nitrospira sp.]
MIMALGVRPERQTHSVLVLLILWSLLVPVMPAVGGEPTMLINGQPVPLGPVSLGTLQTSTLQAALAPPSDAMPGPSASPPVFRDVPSVSGRYSVGGTTLMPYMGAAFSSGYATELDRSLNTPVATANELHFRSLFGQSVTPNEFQMGVRIPF